METESSPLVTVSCANYSQYVAIALRNLFDTRRGTDFEFRCGEKSIKAHKIILELFLARDIVYSNGNEQPVSLVKQEAHDTDSEDIILCTMLEFMYKGEVAVPKEQLDGLLDIARELGYQMLMDAIAMSCCSNVITFEDVPIKVEEAYDYSEDLCVTEEFSHFAESFDPVESSPMDIVVLTLRSLDHERYVAMALRNLYDAKRGTDFELNWDGRSIRAHRIILELFLATETMSCSVSDRPDSLDIKQVAPCCGGSSGSNVLESLLEFLYKGEVIISKDQMGDLLRASKELDFKILEDALVQALNSKVEEVEGVPHVKEKDLKCCSGNIILRPCYVKLGRRIFDGGDISPSGTTELRRIRGRNPKEESKPKYSCPHCEFVTAACCTLISHFELNHSVPLKEKPDTIHRCAYCEFKTCSDGSARRHNAAAHGESIFGETSPRPWSKCPLCEVKPSNRYIFKQHLLKVHGLNSNGDLVPEIRCPYCGFSTFCSSNYQKHQKKHRKDTRGQLVTKYRSPAPTLKCDYCDFSTSKLAEFRFHCVYLHKYK